MSSLWSGRGLLASILGRATPPTGVVHRGPFCYENAVDRFLSRVVCCRTMIEVCEIFQGQTLRVAEALLVLRPRWKTADAIVDFVDTDLRPFGYRLVGSFDCGRDSAVSVVGFRELWSTAWGHYLYIDDLSTVADARGHGHGDALMQWVIAEAQRRNCEAVHLDSGVGSDRSPAQRLYMRNRLQISAHHFSLEL